MYNIHPVHIDNDENETETIDVAVLGCESISLMLPIFRRVKYPAVLMHNNVEIERNF